MNNLWGMAGGAGLQDSLNPCLLMTSAVFIILGLWFKKSPLPVVWVRSIFCVVYFLSAINFDFGPAQIFILEKNFIFTAKIFYFILGIWAFVLGILFFKDWFLMRIRGSMSGLTESHIKFFVPNKFLIGLIIIAVSIGFSALATLWPVNKYMVLLGSEGILKGQSQTVMPLLITYIFTSMWPLWFVWAFLSVKNLKPSLLKIFYAAIFFTASSTMILIFK